jgi:hypothetical protein
MGGYVLTYYAVDVLMWSRSTDANKTRPVPLRYLLGLPVPTTVPTDTFHPLFTLNDTDRANAVIAMGGASLPAPPSALSQTPDGVNPAGPAGTV